MARDTERSHRGAEARHRLRVVALLVVCGIGETSCCACPRPGFAGVPEAPVRSKDLALPLTPDGADDLVRYLADPMPTRGTLPEDLDESVLVPVRARYAPLLARLAESRPAEADLGEGGAWAGLFDAPVWPLVVHDARIEGETVDAARVRGLFRDQFLFVFYWRRLESVACPPNGTAWRLGPNEAGRFSGLVVFPRPFAEATAAK